MRLSGRLADWQRCIICYVAATNGEIKHRRSCASYSRKAARTATTVTVGDLLRR